MSRLIYVFAAVAALFLIISPAYSAGTGKAVKANNIDKASGECIGCHRARAKADHAIGADYKETAKKARDEYVQPESLSPALVLPGGRLSCITCHITYIKKDHRDIAKKRRSQSASGGPDPMLTIDNAGSGLCSSCHKK